MKEENIIKKNRNREKFTFANINLLGSCNANCYFCLGKDITEQLKGKNQLQIHFSQWKNFDVFLERCKEEGVKKLYLTGQTADGLQYHYLNELIDYLQSNDFLVGVRTNGYLAEAKMDSILKMKDEIAYSIHFLKIVGKKFYRDILKQMFLVHLISFPLHVKILFLLWLIIYFYFLYQ